MIRARYRFREFRLVPDTEPDAEPPLVALQCCVCEERSELGENPEDAASWGLKHLKGNATHFTYRTLWSSPVRAEPGPWL